MRTMIVLSLVVLAAAVTFGHDARGAQQDEPGGRKFALLVGVTEYPALDKQLWLQGPVNDARLMGEVLQRTPFSVPADNISTLSGWPSIASQRPTRANIEREFKRLEQVAQKADQIVILMAGHGSQQPANDDAADEEPDGMDEIFLPADIGAWNGRTGAVANAIVDDDIRAWVTAIRNKGAFVWLIFDSCQSGTMARGTNAERDRRVLPGDLKIPESAFRANLTRSRGSQQESQLLGLSPAAGGIAALYAAEMRETTPEKRLPTASSPWHGLFTYTIAGVLQDTRSPLTYRELAQRVIERYRSEGRHGPNPMFEGGGIDREVLDQRVWPDRPDMLLGSSIDGGRWRLRAGSIQGLTVGSVLEMFPPAGAADGESAIGHVRVVSAEATTAVIEPVAFNERPAAPGRLVAGSRGRIAAYDLGADQLRLGVQISRPAPRGGVEYAVVPPGNGPASLERAVADLPTATAGLARRAQNDAEADWVVRVVNGEVALLPASGWNPATANSPGGPVPPAMFQVTGEGDPKLVEVLQARLRQIVRARNLLKLAAAPAAADSDLRFHVDVVRYQNDKPVPVPIESGGRTLRAGDSIAFSIENRGRVPIDVTLLLVDNAFGILPQFPPAESVTAGRLDVGTPARVTGRFDVTAQGVELDQMVAIAVRATTPPINFSALAQPSLEQMRSLTAARGDATRLPGSPLQDLLTRAMFGGGTTRNLTSPAQINEHAMQLIAWRAVPTTQ